ncbi:hypothetical protein PG988_002538 [Apiospora saccharicola]
MPRFTAPPVDMRMKRTWIWTEHKHMLGLTYRPRIIELDIRRLVSRLEHPNLTWSWTDTQAAVVYISRADVVAWAAVYPDITIPELAIRGWSHR